MAFEKVTVDIYSSIEVFRVKMEAKNSQLSILSHFLNQVVDPKEKAKGLERYKQTCKEIGEIEKVYKENLQNVISSPNTPMELKQSLEPLLKCHLIYMEQVQQKRKAIIDAVINT